MSASWEIREGDALERLADMSDESVQSCVTSPPYFGLRDYGIDGQIGLERSPDEFVARLVDVFREVRRVLRSDGTLWLNIGDSYAGSWGNQGRKAERGSQRPINGGMLTPVHDERYPAQASGTGTIPDDADYKPKDLLGIPWLLAFALRADGWYLRSDVIWAKPNPMPESVTDRPTSAHEHVFLLAKSARYFYDADAIREDASTFGRQGSERDGTGAKNESIDSRWHSAPLDRYDFPGRNKRNVWEVATQPFSFDALQGGSAYTASPDCPTHGLRACPERWRTAADGGSQDHYQYRIDSTDARRALGLPVADDATTSHSPDHSRNGAQSSAPLQTSQSMGESRTPAPSSGASRPASDEPAHHTTRTETSNAHPLDSRDSQGLGGASIANGHSTGTRRSDSPSSQGDNADAAPVSRTPYTEPTDAQLAPGGSGSRETSQTPGRSRGRCTCVKYSVDHFATFPPKLIEPCILAGSAVGDVILDPFAGAGTTGLVALRHDRSFIGIELNSSYAEMARERIRQDAPLLNTPAEAVA